MRKTSALLFVPALALGMTAFAAAPAHAADQWSWQAKLEQINKSGASGTAMVSVKGDQITVDVKASGLAAKFNGGAYPHVSHIHIDAKGVCPPASADMNNDGVVSTPEGHEYYGMIGDTLTSSGDTSPKSALDVKRPIGQGSTVDYHRTFTVDDATLNSLKNDTAVLVIHGLDPAKLSKKAQGEDSAPLTKDLPLAATAPALCGAFHASQMSMPNGAAGTGAGDAQGPNAGLLALGGSMILAAGAASVVIRRRTALARSGR